MYNILTHAHSGLRWLVLLFLVWAIINAGRKMGSQATYGANDKKVGLFALIFTHVQLILGLILYFISPKVQFSSATMSDSLLRFYTVEHISLMLIAIVLITMGYSKAKKKAEDSQKFKTTFWYYLIGLVLILVSIPWPFRGLGAGWF
jgi:L-asparagine transporter-like permease